MGLELELSELAVLGPIRTAANSAGGAATTVLGNDGQDAADAGCVTPTAMSPMPQLGGVDDDTGCVTPTAMSPMPRRGGVDDDTGCVTPTAMRSMPPRQGGFDVVDTCCVTPTSDASVLRPATVCPPAPRKPARSPAKRKRSCDRPASQRCFFPVPRDLSTVFVPRDLSKVFVPRGGAAAGPPASSPEAKKIRVHAVG